LKVGNDNKEREKAQRNTELFELHLSDYQPENMGKDKYLHSSVTQFCKTPFTTLNRIFVEVMSRVFILYIKVNGSSAIKRSVPLALDAHYGQY